MGILALLKTFWPEILIGIFIIAFLSYIKILKVERDHYKTEFTQLKDEYDAYKLSNEKKQETLAAENKVISDKYAASAVELFKQTESNSKLNEQRIKDAKELAAIKLSLRAVLLFNSSKPSEPKGKDVTTTKQGNDASTPGSQEIVNNSDKDTVSLQDLLLVVNYNDANHLKCIQQVTDWQSFWKDYTNAIEKVDVP